MSACEHIWLLYLTRRRFGVYGFVQHYRCSKCGERRKESIPSFGEED